MAEKCPVCWKGASLFIKKEQFSYYNCNSCDLLFIDPLVLNKIDQGVSLVKYSDDYWQSELYAAKERSWGSSLARVAELFLYARTPINSFLDIGSGPGYLLDALQYYLPTADGKFFATELFPPQKEFITKHKNYIIGEIENITKMFDGGSCIEVIEHLTPKMVINLFSQVAKVSNPNSIYIFNTGLTEYIKNEDLGYLDPLVRGHITGWSIKAISHITNPLGFVIHEIPGKSWAFLAEYKPNHLFDKSVAERIWLALEQNIKTLKDEKTGSAMYILGLESARAYI